MWIFCIFSLNTWPWMVMLNHLIKVTLTLSCLMLLLVCVVKNGRILTSDSKWSEVFMVKVMGRGRGHIVFAFPSMPMGFRPRGVESLLSPNKYSPFILKMQVVIAVQLLSHVWCCNPMDCSMAGFPVLHYLPEFTQTHVHWVSDAI